MAASLRGPRRVVPGRFAVGASMQWPYNRSRSIIVRAAMHRLLQPADYARMPWKNGGGQTTEIAVHPAGATLADFDWRVSIADITADGPFSGFAGVDRTLVLLSGAGVRLTGTTHMAELRVPYEPYAFSGDDA